ncbi:MAG: hypothetical protein E7195_00545 [Peptococcaceae bacterium]|nr:hypothetical protein [Peptococcaceae bacterium]
MRKNISVVMGAFIISFTYMAFWNVFLGEIYLKQSTSNLIYTIYFIYRVCIIPMLFFSISFLSVNALIKIQILNLEKIKKKSLFWKISLVVIIIYYLAIGITYINSEYILFSRICNQAWIMSFVGICFAIKS